MLVERYLKTRYFQGRAEGKVEGRAEGKVEGRAEGKVEGAAAERQKWRGWLERKATAEREGRPFNEPPPDMSPGQDGQ